MPVLLDEGLWFPDLENVDAGWERDGLVAVGGDLSVERLMLAYRSGIFPWSANPITWWSPDPRAVLELDRFHVSRSLAGALRKNEIELTIDKAFEEVIVGCSEAAPGRDTTWISPEFIEAYCRLHENGHAHSVEGWTEGRLVGGVYGVASGGAFFGESMFHRAKNASKIALCFLVQHLRSRGFGLFDLQMVTPATRQLGASTLPRAQYLSRLREAIALPCGFD